MNILKRLFKILMIFLVILFIAISIFFLTFDLNSYRGIITSKASSALGRQVSIDSMAMKLALIPTVEIKGITIAGDSAFQEEKQPLLSIDSMDATLALIPLLKGQIEIKAFNLATANVVLIEQNGKNNYTFAPAEKETQKTVSPKKEAPKDNIFNRLRIDSITIKKLAVSYLKDTQKHSLSLMNVSVDQLRLVKMTAVYNGKTIKLEANLGDLAGLMAQKPNYSFSLTVDAFDAQMKLNGTIGKPADFSDMLLNFSATGSNLKNTVGYFTKAKGVPAESFNVALTIKGNLNSDIKVEPVSVILGDNKALLNANVILKDIQKNILISAKGTADIKAADFAKQYGIKPVALTFDVTADTKTVVVNRLTGSAGKSDIVMNGGVSLADAIPLIKTQIVSQYFDLYDFIEEKTEAVATETTQNATSSQSLFPDKKIDVSALKKVNASVALTAQYVKLPQIDNIGVSLSAELNNGHLKIPTVLVRTTAGTVKGTADLNAAQTPMTAKVALSSDELSLDTIKAVAKELKGSDIIASVDLTTQGETIKSLVSALNGHIVVEMTKGEILNEWFNSLPVAMGMFKNKSNAMSFSMADQVSNLECGAVNLTVKDGVITSDNQIAVQTSIVNFAISGQINLPKEELTLTMVPSVTGAKDKVQGALSLTQIVKISGPFTKLTPSLDTQKVAETAVKEGLNVLADKLAQKQGITPSQKTSQSAYGLCEKVLGRPLTGQQPVVVTEQTVPAQTTQPKENTKMDAKDAFKQQLLNSLTEALKK